ncbi:MAG: nickel-dependent lactate racemase [Nitrososphaeria archaeon]
MVEVWLPYGKTEISVDPAPDLLLAVLEPRRHLTVHEEKEIENALRNPLGTVPLAEKVQKGDKVVVAVDNQTRRSTAELLVKSLIQELTSAGVQESDITVLLACGTRREPTQDEVSRLLGREIAGLLKHVCHNPQKSPLTSLGRSSLDSEILVNRLFAEADFKIVTGDVEFHHAAGYRGGCGTVLPGLAGADTVMRNLSRFLDPRARPGILSDNPVHKEREEAASMVGVDFAFNVVLDSRGEVAAAFAGDVHQVLQEARKVVDEIYRVPIERKCEIVIASAGGYPRDVSLYESLGALRNAMGGLEDGGVAVLVAECAEGEGNTAFRHWMEKYRSRDEIEADLREKFDPGGYGAYLVLSALERAKVALVSTMPKTMVSEIFKMRGFDTASDALSYAVRVKGRESKVLAIPNASSSLVESGRNRPAEAPLKT